MLKSSSLTSAKTGVAPVSIIALDVAINVISGIITSSPEVIPNDFKDKCNADVALDTPIAYFELVNLQNEDSKFSKIGPSVSKVFLRVF